MPINGHELARMTDLTMIDQLATKADMEALIANAKKYDTWVAVGLKCYIPMLVEGLKGTNTMVITGCSSRQGSDELETKISAAKRYIDLGIGEIENFMNYSYFKSKMYDEVVKDIRAIKDVAGDMTYKVILETPQFNDEELKIACELCIDGGADFVKTGTGTLGATDVHTIEVISKALKGRAKIKASGGIRTLETVDAMLDLGVARFGIGMNSAIKLFEAANNR
ncbi:deoxyribose-phosphate aldolase [Christensenellaceae bacterium NSJ-63]|uniref:Deoxyribose-phosphate aldolase n=1 Tax=Guopingia tenuis TaxID=2763656 RepID=A0A926DG13_9FIRM|nr:deoxyribose-phosphate aldolase [Guopingia tenuis]MBC8537481.1 deoxyribose-phosphate aldolase [Guopingia tenuis]MBS5645580.1 deoxyribose-phosphate aldolase [Clostridiales bacterium]